MIKHIYFLSCQTNGGIFHYLFENGKFQFVEKVTLDRSMYATIKDNKLYVILRDVEKVRHFGGLLSFDIDKKGKLINHTR